MPPREGLNFEPEFNLGWFNTMPGFEDLYATWSEILTPIEDSHRLSAEEACEMWSDIRKAVKTKHGLTDTQVTELDRIACRYAQYLPKELEEEIRDL